MHRNLTDNPSSGSTGVSVQDWRQSADPHPANVPDDTPPPQPAFVESSFGVPYGTRLTDTLGSPNFRFGDYDKDGHVTASDYTVWRDTLGTAGNEQAHPAADPNHDFLVDQADYQIFVDNYQTVASQLVGASTSTTIPEPATIWLLILAGLAPRCRRHVRLQ